MKSALLRGKFHEDTASKALFQVPESDVTKEMRFCGKQCNHAFSYRMGAERAAQVINKYSDKPPYLVVSTKETREFQAKWLQYYKGISTWWLSIDEVMSRNRILVTAYGRKRKFYGQFGKELAKEMTAWEPQSTIADHANGAVCDLLGIEGGVKGVYKELEKHSMGHIINQSHDSIIVECLSANKEYCIEVMIKQMKRPLVVNGQTFTIPVDIEVGERWGEMEKVTI